MVRKLGVLAVAAAAMSDCLDPTEIMVVITTDVQCDETDVTAVAIGAPGDDMTQVGPTTKACVDGGIGTIVVVPSGNVNDPVGIRVTMGVKTDGGVPGDQCVAPDFAGCIVARRSLSYVPHHPLTLPIELQGACFGTTCGASETCVDGACTDAGITCDLTNTCNLDAGTQPICDAPQLVVDQGGVGGTVHPFTPRLLAMPSGTGTAWIVGYEDGTDPNWAYRVFQIGTSARPFLGAPNKLLSNSFIGPLGTDGTNVAGSYLIASQSDGGFGASSLFYTQFNPTGLGVVTSHTFPQGQDVARQGMPYGSGVYALVGVAASADGSGVQPQLWAVQAISGTVVSQTKVGSPGWSNPAVALYGGTYYVTAENPVITTPSCNLYEYTYSAGFLSGLVGVVGNCTTWRVAATAKTELHVVRQGGSALVDFTPVSPPSVPTFTKPVTLGPADDQAIVALTSGADRFRVVWGSAGTISTASLESSLTQTPTPDVIFAGNALPPGVVGFDAAANLGPFADGYAVAYWAQTNAGVGIWFTHCK